MERTSRELELRELELPALQSAHVRNELGEWYAPTDELHDPRLRCLDAATHGIPSSGGLAQNPPVWLDALGLVLGRTTD